MYRHGWSLVSAIIVLAVDTLGWFAQTWEVAGIPGSIIVFAASIVGCACLALLVQRTTPREEAEIVLPDGRRLRFRGDDDVTAEILELQKQLAAKVEQMGERFATRQDTDLLLAYLKAMEQEASIRSERDQISQRTQAIITTLIGLLGGWLPSLLATMAVSSTSH